MTAMIENVRVKLSGSLTDITKRSRAQTSMEKHGGNHQFSVNYNYVRMLEEACEMRDDDKRLDIHK